MARIELRGVAKRWGDGHRGRAAPTSRSATASSWRSSGPRAAASRRRCSCWPASTSPATGDILFDGARVNEVEARDRNVGIVFQSYALYPHMTVRANIRFPLRFKQRAAATRPSARTRRWRGWCRSRSCSTAGRRSCRAASSSAWRWPARWSRSRSSCCSTSRSPTSTPRCGSTMRGEIRRLQRSLGVTTILVTHDQIEATTHGRPGHLHEQGPDRADRHGRRPLPAAGQPVRRRLHRLAADQPAAGRGGAAARLASARPRCRCAAGGLRARSWSASGPSMCAWAQGDCAAQVERSASRTAARRSTI